MKPMRFNFLTPRAIACALALCLGSYESVVASDGNPVLKGSWPGFSRRPASAVVVSGNYAYVGTDNGVGLDIFDLSQPLTPHRLARCDLAEVNGCQNCSSSVAVSGQFAYLASSYSLDVIDIANPVQPRRVGGYEAAHGGLECVAVSGNYAYVTGGKDEGTTWTHGLRVFDVSNPANPQPVGWCPTRGSSGRLVISTDYAFVAEERGLEVLDISNPAAPKPVGWYAAGANIRDVALLGANAYLAEGDAGLKVIDVSDPTYPQGVGRTGVTADCLALSGHYAYVATGRQSQQFTVIDISDPARPKLLGESDLLFQLFQSSESRIAVWGHYAYVGFSWDAGLQVIDISNPSSPQSLGVNETMGSTFDVALSGNYAYLAEGAGGLKVIDVSNAIFPKKVAEYSTTIPVQTVAVSGSYAYLTEFSYESGDVSHLEVVDVSDPTDPRHVGEYVPAVGAYDPLGAFWRVALAGNYAYLTGPGGLQVVDISNPADPRRVGGYPDARDLTGFPWNQSVVVAGDYAYVANGTNGLLVLNVSDPTCITVVGGCKLGTLALEIAVSGHFACVADEDRDLCVIDVSEPANPLLVGQYQVPYDAFWIWTMSAAGNYVCLVLNVVGPGGEGILLLVDISDPSHPQRVGEHYFGGIGPAAMSGNMIGMAGGGEGLLMLEMEPFIKSVAMQGQNLQLSWEGFGFARLQRSTRLTDPDWQDVPGAEVTNKITLPIESTSAFFRLAKP